MVNSYMDIDILIKIVLPSAQHSHKPKLANGLATNGLGPGDGCGRPDVTGVVRTIRPGGIDGALRIFVSECSWHACRDYVM